MWRISFAGITALNEKDLRNSFNQKVMLFVENFILNYNDFFDNEKIPGYIDSAEILVGYISLLAKKINKQVFVLIDEYDNFTNELITGGKKSMYQGILHGEGFLKTFYKALKDATADNFERLFITGVSPIMLDDLTSGFNITENLTLEEELNEIMGFTEKEIREIIYKLSVDEKFGVEELIKDMKFYYNGYKFSEDTENTVYNTDMALYFLKNIIRKGKYPKEMIDDNVKTDYSKIKQIALNFKEDTIIDEIISGKKINTKLVSRFNIDNMYDEKENFKSLLYYLGMLTIKEPYANGVELIIPNYVIKTVYWDYIFKNLKNNIDINKNKLDSVINELNVNGNINKFIEYLKEILSNLSNRDLIKFDEKYIKMILMTLFSVYGLYVVQSEPEIDKGYIDILLSKNKAYKKRINYEWLIELKYLKESERNNLQNIKEEGLKQLNKYAKSKIIKSKFDKDNLKKVLIIVVGKRDIYFNEI
ncbi:AAA family ATPase [Tepidibacter sp.]|uniref:AAA family ATPase n=1 Tax=Tepidibacter sp. TaxID=2529387 RepID=UPI002ECFF329